jgi:DNA-directed RNA polymerase II subunit RPB2
MDDISWKLIDIFFKDKTRLVSHHLDSYNDFFTNKLPRIFNETNPIRFNERDDSTGDITETRNKCLLYLGGYNGTKIQFGKPVIYDEHKTHYMYPNEARLRNMTYGITIHYDIDVEIIYYKDGEEIIEKRVLEHIYLGRFPIMVQSKMCILNTLPRDVIYNMGECRNDYGGYFIIDGKEKFILPQEKFADNMIYIRKNKDGEVYSHYAEIRSVSEDVSKPIRKTSVRIVSPTLTYVFNNIVVNIPNVKKDIPLFIVMRALGIISDHDIIECCLLDMDINKKYIDLFIPSIHDASGIYTQDNAIDFIKTFTKRDTRTGVMDILSNFFLPHIG